MLCYYHGSGYYGVETCEGEARYPRAGVLERGGLVNAGSARRRLPPRPPSGAGCSDEDAVRSGLETMEREGLVLREVGPDGEVRIVRTAALEERLLSVSEAAHLLRPSGADVAEFRRVFGIPYRSYRDALGGLDVLAFDEWLGTGEASCFDVVRERFGHAAAQLLMRMASPSSGARDG